MIDERLTGKEMFIVGVIIVGVFFVASLLTIVTEKQAFEKMEKIKTNCEFDGGTYEFNVKVYDIQSCKVDYRNRTCQIKVPTELSMACVIGDRAFAIYGGDLGWLGQEPYQGNRLHEVRP